MHICAGRLGDSLGFEWRSCICCVILFRTLGPAMEATWLSLVTLGILYLCPVPPHMNTCPPGPQSLQTLIAAMKCFCLLSSNSCCFLKNRDKEAVSPISGPLLAEKRYVRLMNSNALLIAMRWIVNACYVKTPHRITWTNFLIFHLLFAYSDRISPRDLKINCKALKELGKEKVPQSFPLKWKSIMHRILENIYTYSSCHSLVIILVLHTPVASMVISHENISVAV